MSTVNYCTAKHCAVQYFSSLSSPTPSNIKINTAMLTTAAQSISTGTTVPPPPSSLSALGGPDPDVIAAVEQRGNAVVFFDVALGGDESNSSKNKQQSGGGRGGAADLGRIKLELFVKDVSPVKYACNASKYNHLFLSSNFVLQHVINSLLHSKVSKDM
jgi:hypothetical protein